MKSGMPSVASSSLICRLTAPGVTCNSSAASVKLDNRPAASKARSAFSGGSCQPMFCSLCGFLFSIDVLFSINVLGLGRAHRGPLGNTRVPRRELRPAIAPAVLGEAEVQMRQRDRDRDAAD